MDDRAVGDPGMRWGNGQWKVLVLVRDGEGRVLGWRRGRTLLVGGSHEKEGRAWPAREEGTVGGT